MAQMSATDDRCLDRTQAADPDDQGDKKHPNTCPGCGSHYRDEELCAHLRVVRSAGITSPSARPERIAQLADTGSFEEDETDLRSTDPLSFFDLRPYTERLAEAEVSTGLGDAMITGAAAIEGLPAGSR